MKLCIAGMRFSYSLVVVWVVTVSATPKHPISLGTDNAVLDILSHYYNLLYQETQALRAGIVPTACDLSQAVLPIGIQLPTLLISQHSHLQSTECYGTHLTLFKPHTQACSHRPWHSKLYLHNLDQHFHTLRYRRNSITL